MIRIKYIIFIFFIFFLSCNSEKIDNTILPPEINNNVMIQTNKIVTKSEDAQINDYIKRYQLQMMLTGSGLHYQVYYKGNGSKIKKGDIVQLKYDSKLLNGQVCYNSDKDGIKIFEIGKAQVEKGLEEAVLLMNYGDKSKVILPSHLAFGLMGDMNKIAKKQAIVYNFEILNKNK